MASGTGLPACPPPTQVGPPEDQWHFQFPHALVSPGISTARSTWGGLYYHCHGEDVQRGRQH